MEYRDREKIDHLCDQLLQSLDIDRLWPRLLENRIYNRDDVNIPNWQRNMSSVDTVRDICSTIKTRGPHAYKNFIKSLRESGHQQIVDKLENNSASNTINNGNNNNAKIIPESSSKPTIPPNNFNFDEHSQDDYHKKLIKIDEPLKIVVKKAEVFKDGPEIDGIERYPMRSEPRGLVLIITNIVYEMVDSRPSAEHDERNLKQLFGDMGFEVILYRNLTGTEIKRRVKEFSQMKELRRVDSAFVVISSHGNGEHGKQQTEIEGIDYKLPNYETVYCTDLIEYFSTQNCPFLSGKPKTFIFQTCRDKSDSPARHSSKPKTNCNTNNLSSFSSNSIRGNKHQVAVSRSATDAVSTDDSPDSGQPYDLSSRNYDDTLIAYATLPGYVSYRDRFNGSWFIQILCEVFMNYACEKHIYDLFVMTDSRLKDLRTAQNQCQTLWIINQGFNKHCYLNPGLFKSENRAK